MFKTLFPIASGLALVACATMGTTKQTMYEVYGGYSAALEGAVAYSRSPSADPKVVVRLNALNQSAPVQDAVKYGHAYVLCSGSNRTVVSMINCAAWTFTPEKTNTSTTVLRTVITSLLLR